MIQKKICMLGAFAVGKTSLVQRFVKSLFSDRYLTTVGVKIDKKIVTVGDTEVSLVLWDLAGEDEFQSVQTSYLRGASGYLLVIDGTRALPPEDQQEIAVRKRAHTEFIRDLLEDLKREGKLRDIDTTAGALTVIGMVAWIVKWYKPGGRLSAERAAEEVTDIVTQSMIRDDRTPT